MENTTFGVPMMDELTPNGFPRNSFILLLGEGGTGKSVTLLQLAGACIARGEPCIIMAFDDSPASIVENLERLGFSCEKAFKSKMLRIIDCFSFRTQSPKKLNEHIEVVSNPRDRQLLTSELYSAVNDMEGRGVILIDSITELFTMSEPTSTIEMIKDWRAEICKGKYITVFASYHLGMRSMDEFVGMLDYVVDGIIEFRFDPLFAQQGLLARQMRLRKMKGTTHDTLWHYFEIKMGGLAPIKPQKRREESHKLPK